MDDGKEFSILSLPGEMIARLLARKKFRYRRMTFVLKIVLPFLPLAPRLSIVRDLWLFLRLLKHRIRLCRTPY